MNQIDITSEENINLAQIILENKDLILKMWKEEIKAENPEVKNKPDPALLDSMPIVLDEMIDSLSTSNTSHNELVKKAKVLALKHGRERAEMSEYTLDKVILEYDILRIVIFKVIDPEEKLAIKQARVLWDTVFIAIKNAATEFARLREDSKINEWQDKETNFNSIIDAVEDYAIFTLDLDGYILSWNYGALKMKEYTAQEAIGMHFRELYTPEGQKLKEPELHLNAARIEGRFRGEGMRMKKSGEFFLADVYIMPIKHNGEVIGFAKIVQDLTEYNTIVQERDLSVGEAEVLREQNELRDTFVLSLTHDLRNPLTAAKSSAQLILKHPDYNARNIRLVSKIVDHLNRTDKLISNLLDVNRIQTGVELHLNKTECEITEILNEVLDEFSTSYGNQIEVEIPTRLYGFWDREGLKRVMENLLMNAIKYGEQSSTITVSASKLDAQVIIKVHNFGRTIEIPDQVRMFDKFQRTLASVASGKKGWGLGLTVVKGIIEAHAGKVKVQSFPKEGTTFILELPFDTRIQ